MNQKNIKEWSANFIQNIIIEDIKNNKHNGRVSTRFPPEPNGYLHIGHAKSICLNFDMALKFNGTCNLRFDDTNPSKESVEYVKAICEDIRWLGYDWSNRMYYSSNYFSTLHGWAIDLIKKGKAFVCSLNPEQLREYRGNLKGGGKNSPYRDRSIEENLDLFERMGKGEFEEGVHTLRAKIDMASPNINMRDPVIYRILKVDHHRTGNKWSIYPMYDFTHGLSDAIENITHSLCSLEFEDNRPLYDWFVDNIDAPSKPRQIEYARLNLTFTVLSKRKLRQLVEEKLVDGWDDPRMPTISGLRRRGYTPQAIINFERRIGISKKEGWIDISILEEELRADLDICSKRVMGVLDPLKVIITNWPSDKVEEIRAKNHPKRPEMGERTVPFGAEIYIERSDFMEDPPKKFFRLSPGKEVRLRWAYNITCREVIRDEQGEICELRCTYDPEGHKKVKGTIHWVSAAHAITAQVKVYDRLFKTENPGSGGKDLKEDLNPNSLKIIPTAYLEPSLKQAQSGENYQFERQGYFCLDSSNTSSLTFNQTVSLRDSWSKLLTGGKK